MRFLVSAIAVFIAVSTASAAESAKRPNIIFILADDLGYADLGCYGSKYYETPNIDRMAAGGVRFTDGYTCGANCQPTRAALMSGQYNPRTGIYTVGNIDRFNWHQRPLRPVDNAVELPLEKITIAEALQQAGYATGMFGKWHLGNDQAHHPSKQGFQEAIASSGKHFDFNTNPAAEHPEDQYLADFLTDRAVEFIDKHKDEPFFLYLPHYAVHSPYQAKKNLIEHFKDKPAVGGHDDPTYAAMIASLDESVGRVLDKLQELDLADDTLVIYSSDNGGVGSYHSIGLSKNGITNNAPLKGGKGTYYEGGIRVPYIFHWAGKIKAGRTEATPINSVDLYPTLLELAGADPSADYPLDGVSYAALLTGAENSLERGPLYWHMPGYLGASGDEWRTTPVGVIRHGDWKLMEFFEDGKLELYNLKDDVSEKNNLAATMSTRAEEMRKQLADWRNEIDAKMPTPNEKQAKAGDANKGKKQKKANRGKRKRQRHSTSS
jgi:arylsulfatase A-like enzyme